MGAIHPSVLGDIPRAVLKGGAGRFYGARDTILCSHMQIFSLAIKAISKMQQKLL